jgi:hypothetical protein
MYTDTLSSVFTGKEEDSLDVACAVAPFDVDPYRAHLAHVSLDGAARADLSRAIIGIDTLKIGFTLPYGTLDLVGWHHTSSAFIQETGEKFLGEVYRRTVLLAKTQIKFKYIPINFDGDVVYLLLIEFISVPKLLGICSHTQIGDWEAGWDKLNDMLRDIPFLPKLPDVRDAVLYRIDIAANFQVGKSVQDFLQLIAQRSYPHRDTVVWLGKQVRFTAEHLTLSFYDKYKRCRHKAARGILCMEAQFCSRPSTSQPDCWSKGEKCGAYSLQLSAGLALRCACSTSTSAMRT